MCASFFHRTIVLAQCLVEMVQADFFSSFHIGDNQWVGKQTNNPRSPEADCECGHGLVPTGTDKPWNLFIETVIDPDSEEINICTGTIITSNLVLTSHKCLMLPDKNINIYDMWKPKLTANGQIMVAKDHISVYLQKDTGIEIFPVEKIIHNVDYFLQHSLKKKHPTGDIALIQLNADFTTHHFLRPICLPPNNDSIDMFHKRVSYYGAAMQVEPAALLEIPDYINTLTQSPKDCYNDTGIENAKNGSIFCIGFPQEAYDTYPVPEVEGGPLFAESFSNVAYLVGVATKVGMRGAVDQVKFDYAYFTNIMPWIKYIEYRANQHGSKWCKSPTLFKNAKKGNYVWEAEGPFVIRDESLDCECGINNEDIPKGRIAGGEDAKPYEFGWMIEIRFAIDPKTEHGDHICGASIINDRMVLTAAHCVLHLFNNSDPSTVTELKPYLNPLARVHLSTPDSFQMKLSISKAVYHPVFSLTKSNVGYDIALLLLKKPLKFASKRPGIRPICLPKPYQRMQLAGRVGVLAGWGATDPKDQSNPALQLQKLEIPINDKKDCKSFWDGSRANTTDMFICAGHRKTGKTALSGDSGGPLIAKIDNRWYQIAIASAIQKINDSLTNEFYLSVEKMLPYIDYHSRLYGAKWCKN